MYPFPVVTASSLDAVQHVCFMIFRQLHTIAQSSIFSTIKCGKREHFLKFVRFFEDFTQNTQDPTFSDIYFARNKNNTTRQSKQTRRAFVKLDGFALPDAGGFGNSDGENDFVFGLPLLGSGVDAGGADEIELMIDGVEKNAHIAQDEVSKLCLL